MTTEELRHLLEMAAKACGIEIERCTCTDVPFRRKDNRQHWTPDTADGDCLRMIAQLRIDVTWLINSVRCENWNGEIGETEYFDRHNNDRNASLRLCALRVAAQMGEQM